MSETNILLESGTNELEIVEFYLDEKRSTGDYRGFYGINVAKVLEILQMPTLTDMPEVSHPSVLGAFNLREEIIPLIDLAGWLNKSRVEKEAPKVIVTEFNRTKSAFLVSGVTRIHRINWNEVEAPTGYVSSLTVNSITGVVKFTNRIIFILDMEKICADLNPDAIPVQEPAEAMKEQIKQRRIKALVADDSSMARKMITGILEKAEFHVHAVENGELAWNYLQSCKRKSLDKDIPLQNMVDIVVSDIEMPSMDGHTLTRYIKEDPYLKALPVVLCSSIITETLHHKGISVGADDQVSKAELNELVSRVYSLMRTPQPQEA
ncbi:chemotaxis protein [Pseudodesulfovibrio piezophilus]|uniref:Response regulator receiver modulated CheW protein n=1 Tax=Pseudodesulfovibrio piezophilus (strain DSM 21447 / JCM 15486 / C1TLV30) TaxID=1322246 RepID=M1WJZ8_PSEP2|nr:chemotaxis protein [Pseudodesulfovibrio piezophilus]CCH48746.1 Response regulator receiver modulated CheW protein [Pseudodesulfovibrio piezophilus C1TLV30]